MEVEIRHRTFATMIILEEDGKEMGHYSLYFDRKYDPIKVTSNMYSKEPGKGIPRTLVSEAAKYLKRLSITEKKTFVHCVSIVGQESETKLPHLFEENGYEMKEKFCYEKKFFP